MSGERPRLTSPRLTSIERGDELWIAVYLHEIKTEDDIIAAGRADRALEQLRKRAPLDRDPEPMPPNNARMRWLCALILVLSALIGATTFLVVASSIEGGTQPLYVCCTDAGGCVVGPPGQCEGEIYWCEIGESTEGPDGKPAIVCHDGEP